MIGEEKTSDLYKASFKVSYQPGVLKAVAWNGDREGKAVVLETAGKPVALRLVADKTELKADGQDLSYIMIEQVDKEGKMVYTSDRKITIASQGKVGSIIASGTACPNDMYSFQSLNPTLFNGRAMVIVRSGKKPGGITVCVSSEGLNSDSIIINSN